MGTPFLDLCRHNTPQDTWNEKGMFSWHKITLKKFLRPAGLSVKCPVQLALASCSHHAFPLTHCVPLNSLRPVAWLIHLHHSRPKLIIPGCVATFQRVERMLEHQAWHMWT